MAEFAIKNRRGELLAYRRSDWALIFTDRLDLARRYKTRRGARIAATGYSRRYGHDLSARQIDD